MRSFAFMLLGILLVARCRKAELPPDYFADPVFELKTNLGTFTAGQNDLYMCTTVASADDLYALRGEFTSGGCDPGSAPGSLAVELWYADSMASADSVLQPGNYFWRSLQAVDGYRVDFQADLPAQSFSWDLNGMLVGGDSAVAVYADIQKREVSLSAALASGLVSTTTRTVFPSGTVNCPHAWVRIERPAGAQGALTLTVEPALPTSYRYDWQNGSETRTISLDSAVATAGVTVLEEASGCRQQIAIENLSAVTTSARTVSFSYTAMPLGPPVAPRGAALQWVDDNGRVWRSDRLGQPPTSSFSIIDSEPYELNELGRPTHLLGINFQCLLFNEGGESLLFSGTGRVAVGKP